MLHRGPCSAPSWSAAAQRHSAIHSRKIMLAYAQQLVTVHSASANVRDDDSKGGKPIVPVQVSRPPLPCEKPLPLANVMEVQRLLFLLEAPEYCMRAFREHGINGQDLIHMQDDDLDDSRFKFPRHVQRKVLRIAEAWRGFQAICGGPTQDSVSLERLLEHHRVQGSRSPEALSEIQAAFHALDVNNNGCIGFEEFLVGYSLLEAAAAQPATAAAPLARPTDPRVTPADSAQPSSAVLTRPPSGGSGDLGLAPSSVPAATASPAAASASALAGSITPAAAQHTVPPVAVAATAATAAATAAAAAATAAAAACTVVGGSLVRSFASWLRLETPSP